MFNNLKYDFCTFKNNSLLNNKNDYSFSYINVQKKKKLIKNMYLMGY